jgi:hypothetical protein
MRLRRIGSSDMSMLEDQHVFKFYRFDGRQYSVFNHNTKEFDAVPREYEHINVPMFLSSINPLLLFFAFAKVQGSDESCTLVYCIEIGAWGMFRD